MKFTILTILCSLSMLTSHSQDFNKSIKTDDFQLLLQNGVLLVETDNEELNDAYDKTMEEHWKLTSFRTIDLKEDTPKPNDILIMESSDDTSISSFVIIRYAHLLKDDPSFSDAIGSIRFSGFNGNSAIESKKAFVNQVVIGINDICQVIKDQNMKGIGFGLTSNISKAILPNAKYLKGKTLLIVGDKQAKIYENGLKKSGFNYKYITLSTYLEMLEEDMSNYCLLYTADSRQTDLSIFDVETNQLCYTKHFRDYKSVLTRSEFAAIVKNW